ncbi:uncharacterized protein LOC134827983 [Culicoides brevitarsis]|uniref:uncharacterized protein LOC134827983 n=1 Tax=Culicoides brevitarsis TaxID=469753 RepID=UPI00307B4E4D
MSKTTIFLTFLAIFIVIVNIQGNILSFMPLDDDLAHSFQVEWEDKAFISPGGRSMSRFFHGDMTVQKSGDHHLLVQFQNVNTDGFKINVADFQRHPFKLKVENHSITELVTGENWSVFDVNLKREIMNRFVSDFDNLTRLIDSKNWNEQRLFELPLGICEADVKISLLEKEIKIFANAVKSHCNVTEVIKELPPGFDINRALSEDSEGGVRLTVDRVTKKFKELEIMADMELYLEFKKSRYTVKSRNTFEYLGSQEAKNVDFGAEFVHNAEKLDSYKKLA